MPDKDFGICVCGLNGSGKTTLAKALSQKIIFVISTLKIIILTANQACRMRKQERASRLKNY